MVRSSYTVREKVGALAQLASRKAITAAARLDVITRACSEQVARILIEQDYSRGTGKDNVSEGQTMPEVT
jgi:hypothetical protein